MSISIIHWLMYGLPPMIHPKTNLSDVYKEIEAKTGIWHRFVMAHAQVESGQGYLQIGRLGEYGLWQFLPSTWKTLMGNADWKNIENQKKAYIKHANWIISRYKLNMNKKEDRKKFLWIWNAGPGNYEKGILPKSTIAYINKVESLI